jgi:hypothetical protein
MKDQQEQLQLIVKEIVSVPEPLAAIPLVVGGEGAEPPVETSATIPQGVEPPAEPLKATADMTKYMQEYRKKHLDKLRNYDRCKYMKRKAGLTPDFVRKFGDATADAGRVLSYYKLFIAAHPELKETLMQELVNI